MKGKLSSKHKAILKQKAIMGRFFFPKRDHLQLITVSNYTHMPVGKQAGMHAHTQRNSFLWLSFLFDKNAKEINLIGYSQHQE